MKNPVGSRLFFWIGGLGLAASLFTISRLWKWDLMVASRLAGQRMKAETSAELNDSVSSIIRSGFNRDSLLQDFAIDRQKFSFNNIEVELLATNTSNGLKLLVDDPSNFIRYLRSPKSVSDLIPALVCDIVFFCVSYGSAGKYSTLLKWREAYVRQHPGACLLVFRNNASRMRRKLKFTFKFLNHLYLIKAISDGRIVSSKKYDELLQSGLMSSSTSDLRRPALKYEDEKSVKDFIRLLTPHMSSGIGIPSNADMSTYPTMMFLDLDTLFTNKSISVPRFLRQVDEGLKLQPIVPSAKNERLSNDLIPAPLSSASADFIIATDIACAWGAGIYYSMNSGVHVSKPTRIVAYLLLSALDKRLLAKGTKEDQGGLINGLQTLSNFKPSEFVAECGEGPPRWNLPEFMNRIIFASVLFDNRTDQHPMVMGMAQLNRQRNEHMESIWGHPIEYRNGSRTPLLVVVNERWCNSMYMPSGVGVWLPGDWIVHFTGFEKEKEFGRPVREWVCGHLDSVSHPEGWPSSANDCPLLIKEGFSGASPVVSTGQITKKTKRKKRMVLARL